MSKNNEKVIAMVKRYPILYDSSLPEFKNQFSKNKIWEMIGETINKSAEETRSKWKNLRDTYSKYLKSLKPGEAINRSRYGKWQWASSMEFLKDHLAVSANDTACENEAVEENESNSDQNFTTSSKQKTPHHVEKVIWSLNERANKLSSTEHIMIGYAQVLDSFSVHRRIDTKMKIAQIMMQAELEEEEERVRQQRVSSPIKETRGGHIPWSRGGLDAEKTWKRRGRGTTSLLSVSHRTREQDGTPSTPDVCGRSFKRMLLDLPLSRPDPLPSHCVNPEFPGQAADPLTESQPEIIICKREVD